VNPIGKALRATFRGARPGVILRSERSERVEGRALLAAIAILALGACSGNFGSGGSSGIAPPVGPAAPVSPAAAGAASPLPSPTGDTATLPFAQAPTGLECPTVNGFSCNIKFNAPAPTPTPTATPKTRSGKPSKTKQKPKPTASPTPSPSPSPSPSAEPSTRTAGSSAPNGSASPAGSPSASPTPAGANITLQLSPLPKDAPAMNNPDPKALATTPLLALRMHADATIVLDGTAIAEFTLPKEQLGGRSYAIQLYQETTRKKHRDDRFVGSFNDSTLDGSTLRFVFTPPKLEIKKDEVWLFVLYGGETPSASALPTGRATAGVSPSAAPTPTPSPTPEP
jgi:hypothetical protein